MTAVKEAKLGYFIRLSQVSAFLHVSLQKPEVRLCPHVLYVMSASENDIRCQTAYFKSGENKRTTQKLKHFFKQQLFKRNDDKYLTTGTISTTTYYSPLFATPSLARYMLRKKIIDSKGSQNIEVEHCFKRGWQVTGGSKLSRLLMVNLLSV